MEVGKRPRLKSTNRHNVDPPFTRIIPNYAHNEGRYLAIKSRAFIAAGVCRYLRARNNVQIPAIKRKRPAGRQPDGSFAPLLQDQTGLTKFRSASRAYLVQRQTNRLRYEAKHGATPSTHFSVVRGRPH